MHMVCIWGLLQEDRWMSCLKTQKNGDYNMILTFLIGMNGSEVWDNLHQKEYSYFKLKKEDQGNH